MTHGTNVVENAARTVKAALHNHKLLSIISDMSILSCPVCPCGDVQVMVLGRKITLNGNTMSKS